jgi:hypothetical protein
VHGYEYGTLRETVVRQLGRDHVIDIRTRREGFARSPIRSRVARRSTMPPSLEELRRRLLNGARNRPNRSNFSSPTANEMEARRITGTIISGRWRRIAEISCDHAAERYLSRRLIVG